MEGIDRLVTLLELRKKRELKAYAKSLTIRLQDLAEFMDACDVAPEIGYCHQMCRREIVPEHLRLDHEDFEAFSRGPADAHGQKAIRKTSQFFRDRKVLVGHMLHTPNLARWHFFYFSERDYDPHFSRWEHGAHVHFVNWLWPQYSAETVWQQFQSGNALDLDGVHIRFDGPTS